MHLKKFVALLLSAALALAVFAGCGQEEIKDILLGILEGQYQNISISGDTELEKDLRDAARENDTIEDMIKDLEKDLGGTIQFEQLGSGQQGDHTFKIVFQPGSDPDAAAREIFLKWNPVLDNLPADGQYDADVAVIETENGYYALMEVTVNRAGSHSSSSNDDDDDDDSSANPPVPAGETYPVKGMTELEQLIADHAGEDFANDTIQLAGGNYIITKKLLDSFAGTLTVQQGAKVTFKLEDTSLFGTIAQGGKVDGINFEVITSIQSGGGTVATINNGTISNCKVTIANGKYVRGYGNAGGVVARNTGSIQRTVVLASSNASGSDPTIYAIGNEEYGGAAGGIAGLNTATGTITDCQVIVDNDSTFTLRGTPTGKIAGNDENSSGNSLKGSTASGNFDESV